MRSSLPPTCVSQPCRDGWGLGDSRLLVWRGRSAAGMLTAAPFLSWDWPRHSSGGCRLAMASVSAGAGQAWGEAGRQAARALPGKGWLGCPGGNRHVEDAMWAAREPSRVEKR